MKLPEIKKVRESVTAALSKLTAKGADDPDTVARKRAVLREKLALLDEAETAERDCLKQPRAKPKPKSVESTYRQLRKAAARLSSSIAS